MQVGVKTLVLTIRPMLSTIWMQQHDEGLPPLDLTSLVRAIRLPPVKTSILAVLRDFSQFVRTLRLPGLCVLMLAA